MPEAGAPVATYRVQLHGEFTFADAAELAPYLADLGVSHLYCSPILQAAPGSAHGYDVIDHARLSDVLGGDAGWQPLQDACRSAGLGVVVDLVPNHMGLPEPELLNRPWFDVLAHGPASRYADWFDIDWAAGDGKVILPVLGAPLADCLAARELHREGDLVRYYRHTFPVALGTAELPLPALLDAQHYRLEFWRTGVRRLNYRRFFDITTLAGLQVERPEVFAATHARILAAVQVGEIDGLRIDHPDGLADPGGYLSRLAEASGGRWTVVEKILGPGEQLPPTWACAGTTGYDAIATVTGVLTDPAGAPALTALHVQATGLPASFLAVAEQAKREVLATSLVAEVDRLARALEGAGGPPGAQAALVELLVAFDVYRAYPADDPPQARAVVDRACQRARTGRPDLTEPLDRIAAMVLAGGDFATRFAQTTGPVMAKGVEDTAAYRHLRLLALNEVGGDPDRFGLPVAEFHRACARQAQRQPAGMTALSTHDTKRSEDLRARLLVLAELADGWAEAVGCWQRRLRLESDPHLEYLCWQTLAGAWPIERDRLGAYLLKAAREAKLHTSWTDPDPGHEQAVDGFLDALYADATLLADVDAFVRDRLQAPGRSNALAAKLLQLTMPGVPDVYQGCELWDFSLVDPDNRRAVDFAARRWLLAELDAGTPLPAPAADEEGRTKIAVVARTLRLRARRPELFGAAGDYTPLTARGPRAEHLVAFLRGGEVAALATRLPVGLARAGGWAATEVELPAGRWTDALTGARVAGGPVALADVLDRLPVALLVAEK